MAVGQICTKLYTVLRVTLLFGTLDERVENYNQKIRLGLRPAQ
jgi:hypothetical protein